MIIKNVRTAPATFAHMVSLFLRKAMIVLIKAYQVFLSPLMGKQCKHYPSCSRYSVEALERHGPLKGGILTVARLVRCNPWALGGFDPVPEEVSLKKPESFKLKGNYQTQLYKMDES